VIGGLLGAFAAAIVLLVLGAALLSKARVADPPSPVAIPTYGPDSRYDPDRPRTEVPDPVATRPRATPTPARTRAERPAPTRDTT
jgi:hypothetical protein